MYFCICIRQKSAYSSSFVMLACRNALEDCNGDQCTNTSNGTSTFNINLVGFLPVILEFMKLNCVQQASISSQLNLTMFTRGNTTIPGKLHAFLVTL